MHRTQILLEQWMYETLRARAERERRSMSDLIRELLGSSLARSAEQRPRSRLDAMEGIGEDAGTYGEDHDHILYRTTDNE